MRRIATYLVHRLRERSTWGDLLGSLGSAATLPHPWSFIFAGGFLVKTLLPDGDFVGKTTESK